MKGKWGEGNPQELGLGLCNPPPASPIVPNADMMFIDFCLYQQSKSISFSIFHDTPVISPQGGLLFTHFRQILKPSFRAGWPKTILFSPGAPWHGPVSQRFSSGCVPEMTLKIGYIFLGNSCVMGKMNDKSIGKKGILLSECFGTLLTTFNVENHVRNPIAALR